MKIKLFPRLTLRGRKWFFRIVADNGQTVAQSEGYSRRLDALETIKSLRAKLPKAELVE